MRRVLLSTFSTVAGLVLLLSLKPHQAAPVAVLPRSPASSSGTGGAQSTPGPTNGTPETANGTSPGTAERTVTGDVVSTPYGPIQVQVSLTGHKITNIKALQTPSDGGRSRMINDFAVPQLKQEALTAQSARIDAVSGATYTSEGYVQSLQSALDRAGA